MTALAALLRTRIATSGPITVEEYMEACLYHPQHGYYTNGHNFLPYNPTTLQPYPRDFTTAPELTPLFGATLANWVAQQWAQLNPSASQQTKFALMECGPGRGTLMHDMLTHLQTAHPSCYASATPILVEVSPTLSQLQKSALTAFPQCQWATQPASTLPTILIGNEVLDAFPHSQLIVHEGRIQPRTITVDETDEFAFTQTPVTSHQSPVTQITEHSPQMRTWLQALPQTLHAALFADYGASTEGPTGDTLQAVHRHQKVSVFHLPGETDLTTHVNFHNVTSALAESHPHLEAQPDEALAAFLLNHGLASLALAEGSHPEVDTILHRLLHPSQMGTLFKVKCLTTTCSICTRP